MVVRTTNSPMATWTTRFSEGSDFSEVKWTTLNCLRFANPTLNFLLDLSQIQTSRTDRNSQTGQLVMSRQPALIGRTGLIARTGRIDPTGRIDSSFHRIRTTPNFRWNRTGQNQTSRPLIEWLAPHPLRGEA